MRTHRNVDVLRQLSRGEILERQSRRYFLRGVRVPWRLAKGLVDKGLVEPPPTLFSPIGGRITDLGLAQLEQLEKTYDV